MNDFSVSVNIIPSLSSMLLAWATLLVLYFALRKLLYKPVNEYMTKRSEGIQANIAEANKLKEEAIKLREDYELRIEFAKDEGREIVESSRKRGEELERSIVEEARKEAQEIMERARIEIDREKLAALESAQKDVGQLALLAANKILEQEISIDNQDQIVNQVIDKVGSLKWEN